VARKRWIGLEDSAAKAALFAKTEAVVSGNDSASDDQDDSSETLLGFNLQKILLQFPNNENIDSQLQLAADVITKHPEITIIDLTNHRFSNEDLKNLGKIMGKLKQLKLIKLTDVQFYNVSEMMDFLNELEIENSAEEADEDLVFTVHYAAEEEKHEPEFEELNPDPFNHKNKILKKPPTPSTYSVIKIAYGCEDYMFYLNKHIISPIFIANKKQTPHFSYSQKPWSVDKIITEAMNKDSFLYAIRLRDPRFDIAILRYVILKICLDSMKMASKALRSEIFKNKYQEFKKYFNPSTAIEHDIDLQANIAFKKAIGEKIAPTVKNSSKPQR
jgi:hypothetical protein